MLRYFPASLFLDERVKLLSLIKRSLVRPDKLDRVDGPLNMLESSKLVFVRVDQVYNELFRFDLISISSYNWIICREEITFIGIMDENIVMLLSSPRAHIVFTIFVIG